jgi:hypothetical protein
MPRPGRPPQSPSVGGSQPSSAHSTPSPGQRTASLSPASELPPPFPRQDYLYRPNGSLTSGNITSHPLSLLSAGDMQTLTSRATTTTSSAVPAILVPGMARPLPTSNPSSYLAPLAQTSLPPILEPTPKTAEFQRGGSPHMSGSPLMSRGSPHLSAMGYHSPAYPTSAEEQFYFPPLPTTSFHAQSASPEPGMNFNDGSLRKHRSGDFQTVSYDSQNRKVTSTA